MAGLVTDSYAAFADLDFGFSNSLVDDFDGRMIQVLSGGFERKTQALGFNGVDGEWHRYLGLRGRTDIWQIELRAAADSDLNAFERTLDEKVADGRTYGYTLRNQDHARAILMNWRYTSGRMGALFTNRSIAQQYALVFRVMP